MQLAHRLLKYWHINCDLTARHAHLNSICVFNIILQKWDSTLDFATQRDLRCIKLLTNLKRWEIFMKTHSNDNKCRTSVFQFVAFTYIRTSTSWTDEKYGRIGTDSLWWLFSCFGWNKATIESRRLNQTRDIKKLVTWTNLFSFALW